MTLLHQGGCIGEVLDDVVHDDCIKKSVGERQLLALEVAGALTVALGFRGTWIVTGLMLLAVVYLCAWDYHRWRSLLTETSSTSPCK